MSHYTTKNIKINKCSEKKTNTKTDSTYENNVALYLK